MNPTNQIYLRKIVLTLMLTVMAVYWSAGSSLAQTNEIPGYIQIQLNRVIQNATQKGDIVRMEEMDLDSIMGLLEHENHRLASAAAYALGEIRDENAAPALITALKSDRAHMRRIAAHALGKIGDKRAVSPLIEVLHDDTQPVAVQASAIMSLGRIGDPKARRILNELNRSPEKWLQQTASVALMKIHTKEVLMIASAR